MQITLKVAQMLVRITGVLLLILGLLFWSGDALGLIPVHMLLGVLFVLSLWLLAAVASQAGIPAGMAAGVAVSGLIVLILGLVQDSLMPGAAHWVIQVLHLLVGLMAIGSAEMIGGRLRRRRLSTSTL
jgi:hypothetical protein